MPESKYDGQNRANVVESTLELLGAVEAGEPTSQRGLAKQLGVALGLTNAMIKRCTRMGLLKIKEAPARRFAYYLTPKGFSEKSRLVAEYLSTSLNFFRQAREEYDEVMLFCENRTWDCVALYGASDLAEIAILAAGATTVKLCVVIDPTSNVETICGVPVVRSYEQACELFAIQSVVITDVSNPQVTYDILRKKIDHRCILTPPLLRVSRSGAEIT